MPLLGCVADDFTGATDLASTLVRGGMSAVQVIGVPAGPLPEADAVVVALKSRTIPAAEAVRDSLAALEALRAAGCRQFLFKVCSTFDSTDAGNIGPVAEAMQERLGASFALACPAFPANGRSVYRGHLFVGDVLLSESGMRDHPLTPMRDPNLVRVLARQTTGRVGLVGFPVVARGAAAIREAMAALAAEGYRHAIVDAVTEADLMAIGEAAAGHPLLTGGSGVAMGLPENFRRQGLLPARAAGALPAHEAGALPADDAGALPARDAGALPARRGHRAVLAGSCSRATLGQVAAARDALPVLELDPLETPDAAALARRALDWAEGRLGEVPVVIAAFAPPEKVAALQARLGREAAGTLVEEALATVAAALVARGVGQLVVAGGETSGAVVSRLGLRTLRIGREIDPGVPWTHAEEVPGGLHLALKSGNFGAPDFFTRAFRQG